MSQQKTEQPTQRKLKKAREKGEVAKSRELATAAVVLATTAALVAMGDSIREIFIACFELSLDLRAASRPVDALSASALLGVKAAAPVMLVAAVAGGAAVFLQVGPLVTFEKVKPQLNRLDIAKGLRQLFTRRQFVELAKTVAKIAIVGGVAWATLRDGLRGIAGLAMRDADAAIGATGELGASLLWRVGVAIAAIAVLDVLYQRWQYRQDQKMTKEEVKREQRETEGDPHSKQERQRVHREILEHATLEQVRSADVLVVNPTHLAVALQYDQEGEQDAPEVIAKGQDHLAKRMIEAAQQAGVPIVHDVPLARGLYELEVGDEIPEELYEATAAVLHAAWREREGTPAVDGDKDDDDRG